MPPVGNAVDNRLQIFGIVARRRLQRRAYELSSGCGA
jgi:hypothetical protein